MDKNSIIHGLQAGSLIAGMRRIAKNPIAFLYNGVRLPALPEWDRKKYPYAVIIKAGTSNIVYSLYIGTSLTYDEITVNGSITRRYRVNEAMEATFDADGAATVWSDFAKYSGTFGSTTFAWFVNNINNVWTNTNIYDLDGAISFAASEPVPVYE